jgi:osmotically-inducible protein OsmY
MLQHAEDAMSILRLLLAVVLIVVVGAFVMGYLSNRNHSQAVSLPDRTQTADTVARARDGAAQIGEKAGEAATTVGATLEEAALTTKIKAKMALDDVVKARSIDVTTRGLRLR